MNSNKPIIASEPLVEALLPGEDIEPSRRAFLQYAGYGVAASVLSGCSPGPVRQVVPYLTAPTDIISGKGYWLATTCGGCSAACGVLAKCRDGRPIKLEGNRSHEISQGGLCAVGQSEVLSLYDSKRVATPLRDGGAVSWDAIDTELGQALATATSGGRQVRLLTGTEHGPSTRAAINTFLAKYPTAQHVTYDSLSASAILDAHAQTHGRRVLPSFQFDKARVIVSFGADFLGTWISPVAFAADYAKGRRPDKPEGWMSKHIQLESRLSLSGAAADRRVRIQPHETVPILAALCEKLEKRVGNAKRLSGWTTEESHGAPVAEELAGELWKARGQSLIVCGTNSLEAQKLTAYANELLGNYGKTLNLVQSSLQRMEDDGALGRLRADLEAGLVDVLIVSGMNPAYNLPAGFAEALSQAGTLVAHTPNLDETAQLASIVLPVPHTLESWGDGEPQSGRYSLIQPAIPSLRESRSLREMLSKWCGDNTDDRELLRRTWREVIHPQFKGAAEFDAWFDQALHDGYVAVSQGGSQPKFNADSISNPAQHAAAEGLSLVLYPKVGLLDGRTAHNPWMQELPDPISKVTWDNYACLSPIRAAEMGVENGDVVRVSAEGQSFELPVLIQRGQHDDVIAVALGYGRLGTDRFARIGPQWLEGTNAVEPGGVIGVNVASWIHLHEGHLSYEVSGVQIERASGHVDLAMTQDHHTLVVPEHLAPAHGKVRDAVRTASFEDYEEDPSHAFHASHHAAAELWPNDHEPKGHHWGMSIDLATCIGCSACSISCQAENNVPVVGKDEVLRHREMHWMRIDRYFEGDGDETTAHYQPMLCQQCDSAPCEGVCPVLATVHSTEGLNQQVYNRCIGTRYCANTCPYKVRRFNWFNYPHEDHMENQSLNPDVTVRTRGVMEKCSFCYQRIQEAKSEAKRTGTELADGDIQVACQQSCPTQAIVFGDLADPESRVSKHSQRQRSYRVLEEINVKPTVRYLGRIRNTSEEGHEGEHHG